MLNDFKLKLCSVVYGVFRNRFVCLFVCVLGLNSLVKD